MRPRASQAKASLAGASMGRPPAMVEARPAPIISVPSVTRKEGSSKRATRRPLTAPTASTTAAPAAKAGSVPPKGSASTVTTLASATDEPKENSMPPRMRTIAWPQAAMQRMAAMRATFSRLPKVAKRGTRRAKRTKTASAIAAESGGRTARRAGAGTASAALMARPFRRARRGGHGARSFRRPRRRPRPGGRRGCGGRGRGPRRGRSRRAPRRRRGGRPRRWRRG